VAVLAWGWAVLAWDGGEEGREPGARAAGPGETTLSSSGATVGEPAGATEAAAIPDEPAYETTPQGERAGLPEGDSGASGHDHGAEGEPGVYDPLGAGAQPDDLTQTDRERVRYAAERFVVAAYGYTGSDGAEYLAGVSGASLSPDLSLSEGGPEIARYQRQVEETGTRSAARLERFDVTDTRPGEVVGRAYFETGRSYRDDGGLEGEVLAYRQEMTLIRTGETWKVGAIGEVEEL
jgi:hypothetical protein